MAQTTVDKFVQAIKEDLRSNLNSTQQNYVLEKPYCGDSPLENRSADEIQGA